MSWFDAIDNASSFWEEGNVSFDFCLGDDLPSSYGDQSVLVQDPQESPQTTVQRTRVKWSADEERLLSRVAQEMKQDWESIAKLFPGKSVEQVRKRWINKHDPNIKHERWSAEEDQIITALFNQLGGKWQKIAKYLKGRPPEAVKNRYYSVIRKKVRANPEQYANVEPTTFNVDSMLNIEEEQAHPPPAQPKTESYALTKQDKVLMLKKLYERMKDLENLITTTKEKIKVLEAAVEEEDIQINLDINRRRYSNLL